MDNLIWNEKMNQINGKNLKIAISDNNFVKYKISN